MARTRVTQDGHRSDDEVAEFGRGPDAIAGVGDDGVHDALGRRAHQRLGHGAFLLCG